MKKVIKVTIICIVSLLVVGIVTAYLESMHYFVSGTIQYNPPGIYQYEPMCNPEFPLYIEFKNRSIGTVSRIDFILKARYPDRSTNIIGSPNRGSSDHIIGRFDEVGLCYKLPLFIDSNVQPENLIWEIAITNVYWK